MFEAIAFYFFMFLTIVMFLVVVTTSNILYALTALASGMIFISSFFFLLGAEFLGVVQIAVYTGAVVVLYAFGLMFIDSMSLVRERHNGDIRISVMIIAIALLLVMLLCAPAYETTATQALMLKEPDMAITENPNTFAVGQILFGRYVLAFEAVGVLLLVALIAGVALGIRTRESKESISPDTNRNSSTTSALDSGAKFDTQSSIKAHS